jgi:hypothetical protein
MQQTRTFCVFLLLYTCYNYYVKWCDYCTWNCLWRWCILGPPMTYLILEVFVLTQKLRSIVPSPTNIDPNNSTFFLRGKQCSNPFFAGSILVGVVQRIENQWMYLFISVFFWLSPWTDYFHLISSLRRWTWYRARTQHFFLPSIQIDSRSIHPIQSNPFIHRSISIDLSVYPHQAMILSTIRYSTVNLYLILFIWELYRSII